MDLQKIRATIDSIDSEIIRLLSKRIEFAIRTKRFKESIADTGREQEVLDKIKSKSRWLIAPDFSQSIFSSIMAESRRLQSLGMQLVGFHGEHGSAVEDAVAKHNKEWIPIPCGDVTEIFEGIKSGALELGIVPIQNSTEGSITAVIDSLIRSDLSIVAELTAEVHYSLLTLPENDYRDIKVVYSTTEALSHCKEFLNRHQLEGRPYYDAAGAAMMLAREKLPGASVIAHPLCADVYGLHVLKAAVEDHPHNKVRYVVLSKEQRQKGEKSSICFSTKHESGSLLKVLEVFADKKINLTRIESCTNPNDATQVIFLVDFEGAGETPEVQAALGEVKKHALEMKFFGSYATFELTNQ